MGITQAIRKAEKMLPGARALEGTKDARRQAILAIGNYVEDRPHDVWQFVRRWGTHPSEDVRRAIASCLLERLLENHFDLIFPFVENTSIRSKRFAGTFRSCTEFKRLLEPERQTKVAHLDKKIRKRWPSAHLSA